MLISSITARGLTLTTSCMNVPLSSENGPNDIACEHPITSVKKAVAAFTSGTVMPVWSWPRRPGMESAEASCGDIPSASAAKAASRNFDCVMVVMVIPFWFDIAGFKTLGNRGSARRRQLTFDGLRIMRETFGNAARHVADIDFFLAGLQSIEDLRRGRGRRHFRDRQHRGHPGVDGARHRRNDPDSLRSQFPAQSLRQAEARRLGGAIGPHERQVYPR